MCFTGSSTQMGLPKICCLTTKSLEKDFEKYIYMQLFCFVSILLEGLQDTNKQYVQYDISHQMDHRDD